MSVDDQSLIGTILPSVHFHKIILESGGDTNPIVSDDPHIMDKSHGDENIFMDAIAIDQIGEATSNKPNPKTWDATADINDEADTMTTTINFVLKDKINLASQNTMWMFNNLFLNHVKLLVVQMSHYEYAGSEAYQPGAFYESKIYEWLAQYNRKKFPLSNHVIDNWKTFNNSKPQISNIKDYEVKEFTLREVIEAGIPKYLDILKENPDSPTEITDSQIQNKIISSLLEGNSSLSYAESAPLQIEDFSSSNERIINIPFQVQFTLGKEDPLGLSYMAITYFDYLSFVDSQDYILKIAPDLDFGIAAGYDPSLPPSLSAHFAPLVHSTANVKEVIKDGSINKTDVIFLLDNDQEYFGNIKAVDPASNLVINTLTAKQFLDNGYNENPGDYTLLNLNFYTDNQPTIDQLTAASYNTPFANLVAGDQPLSLIKKQESIINDTRIFKQLEQIQFQFENFSNKLVGPNNLQAYNQNIVLKDSAIFTDAWLSLETKETNGDFITSNFMFGVDVGALLENQSLFTWFYQIDNLYSDNVYSATKFIINSIRAQTKIREFQIIRRSVKELSLNPDFSKNRFEPYKGEDPDPHISGYKREVIYAPMGEGGPITVLQEIIGKEEISHQKASKLVPEFTLDYENSPMISVPQVGAGDINFQQLDGSFLSPLGYDDASLTENQKRKLLFISGMDSKFPATGDKRFQYGVRFKVEDGVKIALKTVLDGLVNSQKYLNAIENDLKVMIYSNGSINFPIVDPKTGLFVSEYDTLQGTNKDMVAATNGNLSDAIGKYLAVVGLFSFDTEHVQIGQSESFKIINKLRNNISDQQRVDLLKAISPLHLGSAEIFLKFKKSYDEVILSLRSMLKQQKPSKNQIGTVGNAVDAVGVTYATQKNLIEVEHYFPQTLRSPSNGLTGYDYIAESSITNYEPIFESVPWYAQGDVTDPSPGFEFKSIDRYSLDDIVNNDCNKYFQSETAQIIPSLPPGSSKQFAFSTPDAAKYNFLTPKKVMIDNSQHDMMPSYNFAFDAVTPFEGFNTTNINYSNAMLRILTRAETSKAEYPQILDPTTAYNNDFDLEDSYIASQIMSAKSCVVEGKSPYESIVVPYEDETADPNHEPAYIILPAFDGASKINLDDINAELLPGVVDIESVKEQITQYQKNINNAANLLVHLISNDEFRYMFNTNINNFLISDEPSITPSNDNLLEQLRIKYDSATLQDYGYFPGISTNFAELLSHGIPNAIKYMFTIANSLIGGTSSSLVNPYFQILLATFLTNSPIGLDPDNSQFGKEQIATLYFNFFNIVKVQYLSGFGVTESGKISLKDAMWKNLASFPNEEPDFYGQAPGSKILCRLIPYDDSELINNETKYLDLPILNRYFFVTL